MSKKFVSLHNNTDKDIWLYGLDGEVSWTTPQPFKKGKHKFNQNIPDNSDCSKYFERHHIALRIWDDGKHIHTFSFWDDDDDDFEIKYLDGVTWPAEIKNMRGGDKGGDGTPIVLHVSEHPPASGNYEIAAVALTVDENRKKIASSFKNFKNSTGVSASGKYTSDDLHQLMQHPAFGAVKDKAADSGFGSIGLILGKEKSVVVGKENFTGVLVGFNKEGVYEISSKAWTAGAEEGEVLFVGLYMSTEPSSKVGGIDFFAEIAVDVEDVGFAFSLFTNFWSGGGFMVMLTDGEEIELSVGVGETTVKKIS